MLILIGGNMATTRLDLETKIYSILQKTSSAYGLLTPAKVSDAINDALDFISTMMNTTSSAWLAKQVKINIVANDPTITLPTDCILINFVKKLHFGTQYIPINYDESANVTTDIAPQNTANYSPTYRLVNGEMLLEPTPADALANGILLDYIAAPAALTADNSTVSTLMDYPVFLQFAKWRAASILWSITLAQAGTPPWTETETVWAQMVRKTIAKRIVKPTIIQGMTDY